LRLVLEKRRLKMATLDDLNDPFEQLCASAVDKKGRMTIFARARKIASDWAVLCFSEKMDHPLMWSHYADKHKGLCLAFEIPASHLRKVHYMRARLIGASVPKKFGMPDSADHKSNPLLVKYSGWKYECEQRIIVRKSELVSGVTPDGSPAHFMEFSSNLSLRQVWVGHRSSIKRETLRNLLVASLGEDASADILQKKARLAFRSYRVVEQEKQAGWA